jgi:hypothetical protein
MPRLVGKQSNGGTSVFLLLLIAIGITSALEYEGIINVVPGFGRDFIGGGSSVGASGSIFSNPSSEGNPGTANAPN